MRLKIDPSRLPYRGEPTKEVRIGEVVPDVQVFCYSSPLGRFPTAKERKVKPRINPRYDAWTPEMDQTLLRLFYKEKKSHQQIGEEMGRTKFAIKTRLQRLKERKEFYVEENEEID